MLGIMMKKGGRASQRGRIVIRPEYVILAYKSWEIYLVQFVCAYHSV
jgi:hypothetical protein